ncbi:lysine 5,6-aminomutase reactivase ATPase KamC [Aminipila luticellarii]|uniref:DNA mismatch repair protein MutS n=1 Tax=Aminipila luticellarii TaxID=2507160 RepID=A0A410PXW6_9FIRM|nr:DNA mismatch repair protein MutS [Aminipila luticellarii]QAT43822.1 DNA mismatch repair protein MutS [Aminipila luticellarii]
MRLANVKTRKETGLSYVMQSIYTATPFGTKIMKELEPYMPGQEEALEREFSKMEQISKMLNQKPKLKDILYECFMETKDCTYTLERSGNSTLSVVELFELKSLLIIMEKIRKLLLENQEYVLKEFMLDNIEEILNTLDPGEERINTFYIYDQFSENLGPLRKQKREYEIAARKAQKKTKMYLEEKYNLDITPKFECIVSKMKVEQVEKLKTIPELLIKDQDYVNITFGVKPSEEADRLITKMNQLTEQIEEEELKVREQLSKEIYKNKNLISGNCSKMGQLDFTMGKVVYAEEHHCIRPEIVKEHILEFKEGRHLEVEDILISKGKKYCPVSMSLADGVSCITGANMGGKTVSLKLAGLVQLLTQYGFFVPCDWAKVGLCNFIQILIGDSQSLERGLSSFGSEMEELKEILDNSKSQSLILIDEIASGTNPVEGLALTRSLIEYLQERPYITLITTHFDNLSQRSMVKTMQVIGLENADFNRLDKEIKYADRKERINIISRYMDYRLKTVEREEEIPKDALNIAKILGLNDEIINRAKEFIK